MRRGKKHSSKKLTNIFIEAPTLDCVLGLLQLGSGFIQGCACSLNPRHNYAEPVLVHKRPLYRNPTVKLVGLPIEWGVPFSETGGHC